MKDFLLDKVILLNASVLATITFTELYELLEILLMVVSIIYTIIKIHKGVEGNPTINTFIESLFKNKKKEEGDE